MSMDSYENLDEATRKKIEELQKVTREQKEGFNFADAQCDIGIILMKKGFLDKAIFEFRKIEKSDSQELYVLSQEYIGDILKLKNKDNEAINIWKNIERNPDSKVYLRAVFKIGEALIEKSEVEEAIEYWELIDENDHPVLYPTVQLLIGQLLIKKDRTREAIKALNKISNKSNPRRYAEAQYTLGLISRKKREFERALKLLCNVSHLAAPEVYAQAELSIGWLLENIGSPISVLEAWSRVKREDNKEAYATAQFCTGSHHAEHESMEDAINAWKKIRYSDDSFVYAQAQYKIGQHFINDHVSKKYREAEQAFTNAGSSYPYEAYCYRKICGLLENSETNNFGLSSLNLLDTVLNIVSILTLDFDNHADEEKPFERKLAHYTSTYTCNLLLGNEQKATTPSLFRLNTINNVNDPSEGQLLIRKLKGIKDNNFAALDFNEEFHAFISCFTFNHDSLNQFRLYGKQDNKEASGMSLVFKKEFFQSQNFIGGLSHLSVENSSKIIKNISTITDTKLDNVKMQASADNEVAKYSVMRCVYLDPTSEYFHLAQRNRLTFFREFGEKRIVKNGTEQSQAEYEWGLYSDYMAIITSKFETAYNSLKTIYTEVETEISNLKLTLTSSIYKELIILMDEILLPLKYLIKHSAFREEQECRMIYITSIDRPEVTMEYGSFLYVEYEPSVKDHLDKIYIAPAALHHKRYFDHILKDIDVPVEVSGNVFR